MMYSGDVATYIRQGNIVHADMVRFTIDGVTHRFWSGKGDLTADGFVWIGVGRIAAIQTPSFAVQAASVPWSIVFSPIKDPVRSADAIEQIFNSNYRNAPIAVFVADIHPITNTLLQVERKTSGLISRVVQAENLDSTIISVECETGRLAERGVDAFSRTIQMSRMLYAPETGLNNSRAAKSVPVYWGEGAPPEKKKK